jgi:hypothetical protein
MTTAHIELSDSEYQTLQKLAQSTGKSEKQLLREAIDSLVRSPAQGQRLELLHLGKGIWNGRTDLPDFRQLRAEMDRLR